MKRKPYWLFAAVSLAASACGKTDAPKVPLDAPQQPASGMTGPAKSALDSGNLSFRAKDYDRALAQYEISARLAPSEAAPLLGVLMVAEVKHDQKLTDSTLARLRKIDPSLADTSAVTPHSKAMRAHPLVPPPRAGT